MRAVALLSLAALMGFGTVACQPKGKDAAQVEAGAAKSDSAQFIGLWEPQVPPEEQSPSLFFTDDGRAFFIDPNPEANQAVEMEYLLNAKASPMELDIILPGQPNSLKGIVELTGKDEMRLDGADALEDPRPTSFGEKAVTFKRKSKSGDLPEGMKVMTKEDIQKIQEGKTPAAPAEPAPAEPKAAE
jgi:hypothetical protein